MYTYIYICPHTHTHGYIGKKQIPWFFPSSPPCHHHCRSDKDKANDFIICSWIFTILFFIIVSEQTKHNGVWRHIDIRSLDCISCVVLTLGVSQKSNCSRSMRKRQRCIYYIIIILLSIAFGLLHVNPI